MLADEFEAESEFKKAAEMLGRMRVLLESGTRALDVSICAEYTSCALRPPDRAAAD